MKVPFGIDYFLGNEGIIESAVNRLAKIEMVRWQVRKYFALFKETKRCFDEISHSQQSTVFDCKMLDYVKHFNSLRGMNEIRGGEPLTLQYYAPTAKKKLRCKLNDIGQRICHISAGRFPENICSLRDCFGTQGPLTTDVLGLKLDKEMFCKESTYSNLLQAMQCTLYIAGDPWLIISDEKVKIELL